MSPTKISFIPLFAAVVIVLNLNDYLSGIGLIISTLLLVDCFDREAIFIKAEWRKNVVVGDDSV